jgi:hypothetical protein
VSGDERRPRSLLSSVPGGFLLRWTPTEVVSHPAVRSAAVRGHHPCRSDGSRANLFTPLRARLSIRTFRTGRISLSNRAAAAASTHWGLNSPLFALGVKEILMSALSGRRSIFAGNGCMEQVAAVRSQV